MPAGCEAHGWVTAQRPHGSKQTGSSCEKIFRVRRNADRRFAFTRKCQVDDAVSSMTSMRWSNPSQTLRYSSASHRPDSRAQHVRGATARRDPANRAGSFQAYWTARDRTIWPRAFDGRRCSANPAAKIRQARAFATRMWQRPAPNHAKPILRYVPSFSIFCDIYRQNAGVGQARCAPRGAEELPEDQPSLPFGHVSGISPAHRSVAQSGSASALGAEGRWFESSHSDHPALA